MVGFAAQTSNQPRHNDQSWRIDVATGIVQGSSFKKKRTEKSRKCTGKGHGLSWRDVWKALGRDIVVYKGIQVLSASSTGHRRTIDILSYASGGTGPVDIYIGECARSYEANADNFFVSSTPIHAIWVRGNRLSAPDAPSDSCR